jgi:hypothetical protein
LSFSTATGLITIVRFLFARRFRLWDQTQGLPGGGAAHSRTVRGGLRPAALGLENGRARRKEW